MVKIIGGPGPRPEGRGKREDQGEAGPGAKKCHRKHRIFSVPSVAIIIIRSLFFKTARI